MKLMELIRREKPPVPWSEGEKIPWNEPGFSQRMLKEHLTQQHGAASRRIPVIKQQTAWLRQQFLSEKKCKVLDMGCGPGLYLQELASAGHDCVGIDFSPASVEHAKQEANTAGLTIDYRLGDLRTTDFGEGYDLITFIFGELNVFRREDAASLLQKAKQALQPGGSLVAEVHTFEAVVEQGKQHSLWLAFEKGLFSGSPHLWLQEHFWDEETSTSTTRHFILDEGAEGFQRFAASCQAYTKEEYQELLVSAGFEQIDFLPSLTGDEKGIQDGFFVVVAKKPF